MRMWLPLADAFPTLMTCPPSAMRAIIPWIRQLALTAAADGVTPSLGCDKLA